MGMISASIRAAAVAAKAFGVSQKQQALDEKRQKMQEQDYQRATEQNQMLMKESAKQSAAISMQRTEQNMKASKSLAKTRGKTLQLEGANAQQQSMSGQIGASAQVAKNDIYRQEDKKIAEGLYNNEVVHTNLNAKQAALSENSVNKFTDMRGTGGSTPNMSRSILAGGALGLAASGFDSYLYPAVAGGSAPVDFGAGTGMYNGGVDLGGYNLGYSGLSGFML